MLSHAISPCFTHGIIEQWVLSGCSSWPAWHLVTAHYAPALQPLLPEKLLLLPGWSFLLPWGLQDNLQIK